MKNASRKLSLFIVILFMIQTIFGGYSYSEVSADEIEKIASEEVDVREIVTPDAADITAPVVDLSTLHVSQKTAVPGDTVNIRIKASDVGSGIKYLSFDLDNENGGRLAYQTVYTADAEGYYTLPFKVSDNTHDGRWYISGLRVYDNNNNATSYYRSSADFSAADFVVMNDAADITAPVADLSTLHVSQKTAVPGDTVNIRIKASDVGSGIKYLSFDLDNENGGRLAYQTVYTADAEGYYTLPFKVSDNTHDGRWYISGLRVYDNNNNATSYYRSSADFSAADFVVMNDAADITAPVADLSTLHVSQKTAVPGDTVNIRIKASDVGSGIKYLSFDLDNENGGRLAYQTVYTADAEGYYTLSFKVSDNTHDGRWYISGLRVYDNNNNATSYYRSSTDFSAADFVVEELIVPENKINADYITSNTTWNYKTIDRDVYVGPDAILTIDGDVTINGNLYILGAVVSYGDLTVNSIYANSAYYGYSTTIHQGSMNFRGGTHTVPNMYITGQPIPDIPIEVYSDNTVNENKVLPLLEGATLPIGDLYIEGEKIECYYNGTFSIPDYFVGSKKSIEIKVVDVFEKEHIYTYELNNTNERELLKYTLLSPPDRIEYVVGQEIDLTGVQVAAVYDDGTKEPVEITSAQVSGFNSSAPVTGQIITITIGDDELTFQIDVIEKSLESIEVTKLPDKLIYIVGQELDLTGLEVTGIYNDGEKKIETVKLDNIIGFDNTEAETDQIVTVTLEGKTVSFTVDIIAVMLESIEISKQPVKLNYYESEILDLTGLEVVGTYNNGEKKIEPITMENITGFNSSKTEIGQSVTVTVDGKTATFTVDIIAIILQSIEITKLPDKLSYIVGDELFLNGLEVIGTYNNGDKRVETVTMDNISGFNSTQAETGQVVTVNVNGKTATFMVVIIDIMLVSIEISNLPYKHDYYQGEVLDLTGLEIRGNYNNGEFRMLPVSMENITGFDSSQSEGSQEVTVTVEGKSTNFWIYLTELRRVYMEITKLPDKLVYYVGEELDLTGLEVVGTYNSGETRIVPITMDNVTGFNSLKAQYQQIVVVTEGDSNVRFTVDIVQMPKVVYRTHVQTYGWQDPVSDGATSGTTGEAKRLEGIEILMEGEYDLGVKYSTHVQKIGWQNYVGTGEMSGTEGRALRLEAIKIELTGTDAERYDIYYRVHAEKFGWMGWAKNGQAAGTAGYAYRLEAIEISIVKKGENPYPVNVSAYRDKNTVENISYRTHVQSVGWQDFVSDGEMSGTEGRKLRLEGIEISLGDHLPTGAVEYSTHVQSIGWTDPVSDGVMSGTEGRALRLEAIRINLTGEMSRQYDIYYRVHSEKIGWMGWAKNGEDAGTSGYAYRLEGIEIILVEKGGNPPGSTMDHYRSR